MCHVGCRSGQNYAWTLLSNLAVRLSTLVSGTLQLVSGTVHLNKWDCPPYKWDCPPYKWDCSTYKWDCSTYKWDCSTYKWDRKWHDILPVTVKGVHEKGTTGKDLLQLCAALVGTDSRQKRTHALDLLRKQTN